MLSASNTTVVSITISLPPDKLARTFWAGRPVHDFSGKLRRRRRFRRATPRALDRARLFVTSLSATPALTGPPADSSVIATGQNGSNPGDEVEPDNRRDNR